MIRKFFRFIYFWLFIIFLYILWNSVNAYQLSDLDFYKEIDLGVSYQVNSYAYSNIFSVSSEIDFYSKVEDNIFNKSFTVWSNVVIWSNNNITYRSIGWIDWKLYWFSFYAPTNLSTRYKSEWFFQQVCKIPSTTFTWVLAWCSETHANDVDISEFYSWGNTWKKAYVFWNLYNVNNVLYYCFDNWSFTYCVWLTANYNNLTWSLWYNDYTVQSLLTVPFTNSDFMWYDIEINYNPNFVTNQDILDYYQSIYKWDRNLCYLWTDYLGINYTWDYQNLWWLTIFEWYNRLYSWTNVSDPYSTVSGTSSMNVGGWLNTIMNNYNTYMNKRQDYTELSCNNCLHYSYWWNNWLYSLDRWYNFNPFDWRPSVELWYSSKAVNRYNQVLSAWWEIAIYCYAVFHNPDDKYTWVFPQYLKDNLNNYNVVKENNSIDWQNSDYQVPSWSWFMSTTNEDFWTTLKKFFAKLTEKLNVESSWFPNNWVIPEYILWFLTLFL